MLFFVLWVLLAFFLKLPRYIPLEPQGIHFIRQTDGMAFMMGYYQFGNAFFEPRVYDLLGENGRAASEFPLMYYIGAGLAKILGPSMGIMRGLSLLVSLLGLWSLFQILYKESQRFLLSFSGALVSMLGVVYFYYAINTIPDIHALGFCMMAWYFFYRFYVEFKKSHLYWATLFFALASLIKITFLIQPLACFVVLWFFFPKNDIIGGWNRKQWLKGTGLMALIAVLCSLAWVLYAKWYNQQSGAWYFLSRARPIWELNGEQIREQFTFVMEYWGESYFHVKIWKLWGAVFLFNLYGSYKLRTIWNSVHWILLGGLVAYALFFFRQFADHDYYFLLFYPWFGFSVLALILNMRALFPRVYKGIFPPLLLLFFCYIGLIQTESLLTKRFAHDDYFAAPCLPLKGFYQTLDSLQIPQDARFVILGDISINGSQYFIRRQGYSVHDTSEGQFRIMENLREKQGYEYALSIDSLSFGRYIDSWNMKLLHSRPGIALYKIEGKAEK